MWKLFVDRLQQLQKQLEYFFLICLTAMKEEIYVT